MQLSKPRVVIVGAGFGGLRAAKKLGNALVDVILIDRNNHHLFQPLLYQVAASALSPGDIASPIRTITRSLKNVQVIMNEAKAIDRENRRVILEDGEVSYDYLILAPGAKHSYFGNDQWAEYAPGLKTLSDALDIREQILISFEKAERLYGTREAEKYLTFVVVGGGPTGVEMAGAIAEIGRKTMIPDFPLLKPEDISVILVEAVDKVLMPYPEELSNYSVKALEDLGVEVQLGNPVTNITEDGVETRNEFIETKNIFWAAGNEASPILKTLNTQLDKAGRVIVNRDCSIPEDPNIFVIGDAAAHYDDNGNLLPGVAPAAMQQGKYAAKIIKDKVAAPKRPPFKYVDKGSMATIGRAKAVAYTGSIKLKGFLAWLFWAVIHIFELIDFRNRLSVMIEWFWYYLAYKPGAHLIVRKNKKEEKDKKEKIKV